MSLFLSVFISLTRFFGFHFRVIYTYSEVLLIVEVERTKGHSKITCNSSPFLHDNSYLSHSSAR